MHFNFDMEALLDITYQAGDIALEHYHKEDIKTHQKADHTPVSEGDIAVNNFLENALSKLDNTIAIVSEETAINDQERMALGLYWLIDPIDGTKAYIAKKNGEFTINIALMKEHRPVIGVIYAPYHNELFYAVKDEGAYLLKSNAKHKLPMFNPPKKVIYTSHSHRYAKGDDFVNTLNQDNDYKIVSMSSSLKICKIAQGEGAVYARFGPTSEWDIASGDIILTESGKQMTDLTTSQSPLYGKSSIRNNDFIAKDKSLEVHEILQKLSNT